MVRLGVGGGLPALLGVLLVTGIAVERYAPSALLLTPERPYAASGDATVRTEGPAYPRAAIGADDVRMSVAGPVRRLVSQYWSVDDFAYAVAPPEHIVGVSESSYERRISNVTDLVERFQPVVATDPERVLRARPDLVLSSAAMRADHPALLRSAQLNVYRMFTAFETLASIEEQIRLVGYLTGDDAAAQQAAERFRTIIRQAAARRPAGLAAPRVLGFGGRYSYGAHTLFTDILRVLGAENVAASHGFVGYDRLTDEHIVRWDPEWIVAGANRGDVAQVRARLLANQAIAGTTAARRGQIVVLENHVFLPLSPFTAQFVDALSRAFYGEEER